MFTRNNEIGYFFGSSLSVFRVSKSFAMQKIWMVVILSDLSEMTLNRD
uniref:Uncharacterized protein n=1 Tax=uncultured beta proteobacterium HF0010_04H24 TaxID=710818 RepID=E0XWP2_9PROT|nr:hypothetical protein [uncultured beta proteobacterium HF0010_04H24]